MKPLENITILEFSTMVTASFATMMLAEQGARAIKVEPIDSGDPMRLLGTQKGGMSGLFASCNRGKESIGINLKHPEGVKIIKQLAREADVVIHNYRPGVMDALNLGSETLRAENSRLVYMAISGFGTEGPLRNAPAYDPIIQAHAGFTAAQGQQDPAFIRNLMCDKITAYTACQAVTAALLQRERTGHGQHIDLSMLDAGLFFIFPDGFMNDTLLDDDIEEQPLLGDLLYELTLTKDGGITISAATDKQRAGLLKAIDKEHMLTDERFNSLANLMANYEAFRQLIADRFLEMTTDEAVTRLLANDVPCAKCHSREEVLSQPQTKANESLQEIEHPIAGKIRVVRSPAKFTGERLPVARPSPGHGEQTQEVLEEMGIDSEQFARLKQDGIVS